MLTSLFPVFFVVVAQLHFLGKVKGQSFIPGKGMRSHEELVAAANPALETFKSGKRGRSGSFYPGKGIRSHEELVAAANPALETFKSGGRGRSGSFYPGKGIRDHASFNELC